MNANVITALVFLVTSSSCAHANDVPMSEAEQAQAASPKIGADYNIYLHEDKAYAEFDLLFVSTSSRYMCIELGAWPFTPEPGGWPFRRGEMVVDADDVYVLVAGERYPIKRTSAWTCDVFESENPDVGCATLVAPGEALRASIPFSEFEGLPDGPDVKRELVFNIAPRFCTPGR